MGAGVLLFCMLSGAGFGALPTLFLPAPATSCFIPLIHGLFLGVAGALTHLLRHPLLSSLRQASVGNQAPHAHSTSGTTRAQKPSL